MSITELRLYTEAAEQQTWLGQLVTYTVTEQVIDFDALTTLLRRHGLAGHAPRKPADSDVFRRVCSTAERKKMATQHAGVFVNILVRNVGTDENGVVTKKIVAERVDAKGKRLDYTFVYDLTYEPSAGRVETRLLQGGYPEADAVALDIRTRFPAEQGCVDGGAVRTLIRRVLLANHAVGVRESGGLYFIRQAAADIVTALHAFASELPGVKLYRIPLVDNTEQREMIAEAATTSVLTEVDSLITEVGGLLTTGDLSTRRRTSLMADCQQVQDRIAAYTELLNDDLGGARARLTMLERQMAELMLRTASA